MVSAAVPAVVIAAPASGSGKTTVATGLVGALRRAGRAVAPFKVGPDYIDPGYHALAAGRAGRNLDTVLVGAQRIGPLYRHGSAGCDIAVVEGVMGLFDGRITDDAAESAEGSTAHVASLLGAPVILVVDARGHSQSLAALLHGFATYDPQVRLGGVILNRVGSDRHDAVLRAACARAGLPVLGSLPRMTELAVPSRHLGLVPAVEHGSAAVAAVEAMTDLVAAHVDISAVATIARASVAVGAWDPAVEVHAVARVPVAERARAGVSDGGRAGGADVTVGGGAPDAAPRSPVVAIAGGPAFTFGYAEHRELLAAAGARVLVFDPLTDPLPPETAGLVLPGGFPEEHAGDLSANVELRTRIAELAARGLPVHAECAGLLYLARALDGHPMAGVLDVDAEFGPTLTLGYRDATALIDSTLWSAGERVRGHEFHRTRLTASGPSTAWGWRDWRGVAQREGFVQGNVHASYLHTHPAGNAPAVARFVTAATAFAQLTAAR